MAIEKRPVQDQLPAVRAGSNFPAMTSGDGRTLPDDDCVAHVPNWSCSRDLLVSIGEKRWSTEVIFRSLVELLDVIQRLCRNLTLAVGMQIKEFPARMAHARRR